MHIYAKSYLESEIISPHSPCLLIKVLLITISYHLNKLPMQKASTEQYSTQLKKKKLSPPNQR